MARYMVRVKPNAKKPKVEPVSEGELAVSVNAPAAEGKANKRLVEILSEYFQTAKSKIKIVHGANGRTKLIEIR